VTSAEEQTASPTVRRRRRYGRPHVSRATDSVKRRYTGSSAEDLWSRLGAMDFINRGMLFAATLLLCFFPFIIIANALAGRTTTEGLTRHLGLNKQAASVVSKIFTSPSATSNAITGTAWVWFILGGVAGAAAIQQLYERAFDLDSRGLKDLPRQLLWVVVLVGCSILAGKAAPALSRNAGPVLLAVVGLIAFSGFWWFSMWLLLGGRVKAKDLFPAALATGICWIGMEAIFSVIFSSMVISYNDKYGPVGVVLAMMSWFIAIGVVIILGAVAGVVWRQREMSVSSGVRKVLRRPSRGRSS
jgi:membrane protein